MLPVRYFEFPVAIFSNNLRTQKATKNQHKIILEWLPGGFGGSWRPRPEKDGNLFFGGGKGEFGPPWRFLGPSWRPLGTGLDPCWRPRRPQSQPKINTENSGGGREGFWAGAGAGEWVGMGFSRKDCKRNSSISLTPLKHLGFWHFLTQ